VNSTLIAVWLLIALAATTANVPFLTERVLGVLPWRGGSKPVWLRLLEVLFFYLLVGAVGFAIEARLGNRHTQGWAFYAITASLYLVMAYPGYVYRYLRKQRRSSSPRKSLN